MGELPPSLHRDSFYLLMPVREGVGKVFCLGQLRVTGAQAAVFSIRQNPKVTKSHQGASWPQSHLSVKSPGPSRPEKGCSEAGLIDREAEWSGQPPPHYS